MSNKNIMEAVAIMADEVKKWRSRAEDFQARWLDTDQKLGEADIRIEELINELNMSTLAMTEAEAAINMLADDRKDRDKIIVELTDYIENAKKLNQANRERMGAEPHESATEALIRVLAERDELRTDCDRLEEAAKFWAIQWERQRNNSDSWRTEIERWRNITGKGEA